MEIERKWMVTGWPDWMEPDKVYEMEQGYVSVYPATVRIRREAEQDGPVHYVLCFKGKGKLARQELEQDITKEFFDGIADIIGKPLIPKTRKDYKLEDGLKLEVNLVDAGMETEFCYAEVEFPTVEAALEWKPQGRLAEFLNDEVTNQPGQSMGAYWMLTRCREEK